MDLARQAQEIEKYFQTPQDIEWAVDNRGEIFILQSRALKIDKEQTSPAAEIARPAGPDLPVLLTDQGIVVRQGTTAGRVFVVNECRRSGTGTARGGAGGPPRFPPVCPGDPFRQRHHHRHGCRHQPHGLHLPGIRHPHRGQHRQRHRTAACRQRGHPAGRQRRKGHGLCRRGSRIAAQGAAKQPAGCANSTSSGARST